MDTNEQIEIGTCPTCGHFPTQFIEGQGAVARQITASASPRFQKLDANLQPVADDAVNHAAVLDRQQNLIFAIATGDAETEYDFATASKLCADLRLGDKNDWRLPTVHELFAIVDHSKYSPAIDEAVFPNTEHGYYWTSTPCAWRPGSAAWCVAFGGGYVGNGGHAAECFVRAVRVASPAAGQ
jgi:hypothetical protein